MVRKPSTAVYKLHFASADCKFGLLYDLIYLFIILLIFLFTFVFVFVYKMHFASADCKVGSQWSFVWYDICICIFIAIYICIHICICICVQAAFYLRELQSWISIFSMLFNCLYFWIFRDFSLFLPYFLFFIFLLKYFFRTCERRKPVWTSLYTKHLQKYKCEKIY